MATPPMRKVVDHLRRVALLQGGAGLRDEQLLETFLVHKENAAFQALIQRHGPMVFGVCLRILHDRHDAEDAFQATFLVLIRKAASIGQRELLANWLYGVAHRTALQARKAAARRRAKESQVADLAQQRVTGDEAIQEMLPFLDQALSRLPDKYRVPIILCDLEAMTRKKAAQQLGILEETFSSRLDRARVMLAKRLARYGTTFSASGLALVISENMASAAVPHSLVISTVKAGTLLAAGPTVAISAKVLAITEGVLTSMLLTKVKFVTTVLLLAGVVCTGAAVSTHVLTAETNGAQQVDNSAPVAEEIPKKILGEEPKESSKQPAREDPKIRELLKERLETLKKRLDSTMTWVEFGKIRMNACLPAFSQYFHAELDFCESDRERLTVCERALVFARKYEMIADEMEKRGDATMPPHVFLDFVLNRLEVQIAYERAKAKATKAK